MNRPTLRVALLCLALGLPAAAAPACADEGASGSMTPPNGGTPGSTGITQPGAQDFGLLRDILDRGELPGPDTVDDLGFFAEHKLDYPAATCGDTLCVHGLVGVMGNLITGANCTVLQIGLNSPIDVDQVARPALNLVFAIDVSGSMSGQPISFVRSGLLAMLDYLEPDDRVSIVTYSSEARIVLEGRGAADRQALETAILALTAGGSTNLYDGLFTAFEVADRLAVAGQDSRVVMLSDGVATAGLADRGKLVALAQGYARMGLALTTIGVGSDFDVAVMRSLAEVGAGNFYFLEDPQAVEEVFTEEVKTFLVPVALDVTIDVTAGGGYFVRQAYGTRGFKGGTSGGTIEIPALFLAGRTDASAPVEGGRRGGGGAIILELMPRAAGGSVAEPHTVGTVTLSFTDPATGERRQQQVTLASPHLPGETPLGGWFSDATVEKGFVMLNIFAALQMAATLAADADAGAARGVLEALRTQVAGWLVDHPDPDIADDLTTVGQFIAVLAALESATPLSQPPEPWPID